MITFGEAPLIIQITIWTLAALILAAAIGIKIVDHLGKIVLGTVLLFVANVLAFVFLWTSFVNALVWTGIIGVIVFVFMLALLLFRLLGDGPSEKADGTVLWSQRKRNWCRTPFTFTRYTVTDNELDIDSGLIKNSFDTTKMFKIVDLQVTQTLLQRIFGLSDITLAANDPLTREKTVKSGKIVLHNVINGYKVRIIIQKAIDEARQKNRVSTRDIMSSAGDFVDDDGDGVNDAAEATVA